MPIWPVFRFHSPVILPGSLGHPEFGEGGTVGCCGEEGLGAGETGAAVTGGAFAAGCGKGAVFFFGAAGEGTGELLGVLGIGAEDPR